MNAKLVPFSLRCTGSGCLFCRCYLERFMWTAVRYAIVYGTFGALLLLVLRIAYP